MSSQTKTDTDGTIRKLLKTTVGDSILQSTDKKIAQAVEDLTMKTGTVTKFYPYLDKAEVKLKNNNKVLCRLPHRFMGSLIDFYTPGGDRSFCNNLREPCIIPRDTLNCLVAIIDDEDMDYFLISFYISGNIVGFSPPDMGSMKICNFRVSNEDYIEFGGDGLKIVSKKPIESSYGEYEDKITVNEYADASNVYSKDEVYTKEDVDELIKNKIAEALGDDS